MIFAICGKHIVWRMLEKWKRIAALAVEVKFARDL